MQVSFKLDGSRVKVAKGVTQEYTPHGEQASVGKSRWRCIPRVGEHIDTGSSSERLDTCEVYTTSPRIMKTSRPDRRPAPALRGRRGGGRFPVKAKFVGMPGTRVYPRLGDYKRSGTQVPGIPGPGYTQAHGPQVYPGPEGPEVHYSKVLRSRLA